MEPILLLANSAPSNPNLERAFQSALALKAQGHPVSMFLLQDAVLAGLKGDGTGGASWSGRALSAGVTIFALNEDLSMRGFSAAELWDGIQAADYGRLVDLFDQHTRVIGAL
jgi:sulfur relay protein TusB/DsrH